MCIIIYNYVYICIYVHICLCAITHIMVFRTWAQHTPSISQSHLILEGNVGVIEMTEGSLTSQPPRRSTNGHRPVDQTQSLKKQAGSKRNTHENSQPIFFGNQKHVWFSNFDLLEKCHVCFPVVLGVLLFGHCDLSTPSHRHNDDNSPGKIPVFPSFSHGWGQPQSPIPNRLNLSK